MRGKPVAKRNFDPDAKYNSVLITKFINHVMRRGKKSVAQTIVYKALDLMAQKSKKDPIEMFDTALKNVMPVVEVRSRRIGGANYQIPVEVKSDRKSALAFRWILDACRARRGQPMHKKLAQELLDAAAGQGSAIKKREDVQRMAEANRAFAHFA